MSVQAYGGATSVRQGSVLAIHASNSLGSTVNLSLVTHGDYVTNVANGQQPANVLFSDSAVVGSYGIPIDGYAIGYRWQVAFRIPIDPTWPSGVYDALLDDGTGTPPSSLPKVQFVVRPANPTSTSPILVCVPVATMQAYNFEGGKALYWNEQPDRSHKVSFDRPGNLVGNQWWPWLETGPFAFEFCTSIDLHRERELLFPYQLLLSIGHDEYWSFNMREHVERFIAQGGNVAFFSGNVCWWQCRFEDDARTMVCYRDASLDPLTGVDDRLVTVRWTSAPLYRPENHMTGVSFRAGAGTGTRRKVTKLRVTRFGFPTTGFSKVPI